MNLSERIDKILEHFNISAYKLAKNIGTSEAIISNIRSGKTKPSYDFIEKLLNKYEVLDAGWLITGDGKMIKSQDEQTNKNNYYSVKQITKNDVLKDHQQIPLYNIHAQAGIVSIISNSPGKDTIPMDYIRIPNLPKCDGAIPMTGDSMYPLLKAGDILIFKEVNDPGNIIYGEMYILAIAHNGDDFLLTKYIQKSGKNGWISLISENKHHQPVDFPLKSVRALAHIKATVRINTAI